MSRLEKVTVEYVPIGDLKPNDFNTNRQTPEQFEMLVQSMLDDGFTTPIIAVRETQVIVDGEHRWRAAQDERVMKALGIEKSGVPVVFVDMDEVQHRVAMRRHNTARGEDNLLLAAGVIRELQEAGALALAQTKLQLDEEEVARLVKLGAAAAADAQSMADDAESRERSRASVHAPATGGMAERTQWNDQHRMFIVTLPEFRLVRHVLGEQPAVRLYELCLARHKEGVTT